MVQLYKHVPFFTNKSAVVDELLDVVRNGMVVSAVPTIDLVVPDERLEGSFFYSSTLLSLEAEEFLIPSGSFRIADGLLWSC